MDLSCPESQPFRPFAAILCWGSIHCYGNDILMLMNVWNFQQPVHYERLPNETWNISREWRFILWSSMAESYQTVRWHNSAWYEILRCLQTVANDECDRPLPSLSNTPRKCKYNTSSNKQDVLTWIWVTLNILHKCFITKTLTIPRPLAFPVKLAFLPSFRSLNLLWRQSKRASKRHEMGHSQFKQLRNEVHSPADWTFTNSVTFLRMEATGSSEVLTTRRHHPTADAGL